MSQGGPEHNGTTDEIKQGIERDYDTETADLLKRWIDEGEPVKKLNARQEYIGTRVEKSKPSLTPVPAMGHRYRRSRGWGKHRA